MAFFKQFIALSFVMMALALVVPAIAEEAEDNAALTKENYVTLEEFEKQSGEFVFLVRPQPTEIVPPKEKKVSLRHRKNCTISSSYRMCI